MTRKLESPFVHLLLLVGAIAMLMPFAWMVSTSLKAQNEVFSYPPQWIPSQLLWSNYAQAWAAAPFGRYFINSGIVALAVTFLDLVTSALAAFAFGRMQFPLRNALFTLYLASMMIPHQMTIIPAFLLLKNFGDISPALGLDSYFALVAPFAASAFGVFMLRQSFMQIPNELEDAAVLDGCGRLGFLVRMVLPLSRPALATLALFAFQANWNSYLWPLIVTNSDQMRTVQIGLRYFVGQEGSSQWGLLMAAAVFVSLPVVVLYLFVQRQFTQGIASTGLKQ
ncbi:MAG TPA: carbohydrate ABC transporter permease [Thermoflexales bacterium]|nr:carbohydrate ABC transporter permease [Anaerolineae bacterium]HQV28909.1 carbohydrate ABC transporter permease [Thermoflexales bacterium]HQX11747.1 carbohydrate ABC transporter permease [Thermoflexales bacterium]HQY26769.1 carbohydrate ABC transporter permease [Thermoflexales bacterium]HQZ54238.1 carbohydrate ABC transporter permease [Thermoflexales bacterium]